MEALEETATPGPYRGDDADLIRQYFIHRTVSDFEREVNEPRFMALLPRTRRIKRIANLGSGPAYPAALREQYPGAEIVCFDFPEMLPELTPDDPLLHTTAWGPVRKLRKSEFADFCEQHGQFDLIVMKMFAHYVQPDELARIARLLLARKGSVALSIPHPEETEGYLGIKRWTYYLPYVRTIGNTGVKATMYYRPESEWVHSDIPRNLPEHYRRVIDEPTDQDGKKRRLNVLYRPPTIRERTKDAMRSLFLGAPKLAIRLDLGQPK